MQITHENICSSVAQVPFGTFEPFITGDRDEIWSFFSEVIAAMEHEPGVGLVREDDHHGSGYASYISVFVFPKDGSTRKEHPDYWETTGLLVYMSRLAPIAVFGASKRCNNKDNKVSSSGFIETSNVGLLPEGEWVEFLEIIANCLRHFRIEFLAREPLLQPAPDEITIPTIFNGPYFAFDTLFYWCD